MKYQNRERFRRKLNGAITLYVFAMDYHSGQRSRGYRLLSTCARWIRHQTGEFQALDSKSCNFYRVGELYRELVSKYADKV